MLTPRKIAENKEAMHLDIHTIEDRLRQFAEFRCEISALYLFGSVLLKDNPEDIDIAVLVDPKKIESSIYPVRYVGSLITDLMDVLQSEKVDVVFLNNASPVICMQVLGKGKILYERDPHALAEFSMRAIGRYHDLKMVRKPIEQQILNGRIYG